MGRRGTKRELLREIQSRQWTQPILEEALAQHQFTVDEVLVCLFDRDEMLQRFGAQAIGLSREENKVAKLLETARTERSADRQERLYFALNLCDHDQVYRALARLVNSPSVLIRRQALTVMTRLDGWFLHRDMVTILLEDPSPSITTATIHAVVDAAPERYTGLLRHLASDERSEIRELVIRWLVNQQEPANIELFIARLPFESPKLQALMSDAIMASIRDYPDEATLYVVQAIGDSQDEVRRVGVRLFGQLPDRVKAVEAFLRHAIGSTEWVRDIMFLEATHSPNEFVNALMQVMKQTRDMNIRLTALNFAAILRDSRLIPVLEHELDCDDWVRRYNAIKILGEMGLKESVRALVRALSDEVTAPIAIHSLMGFNDPSLTKAFLNHIPGASLHLQRLLLRALVPLGDPRAVDHIVQMMHRGRIDEAAKPTAAAALRALCEANQHPLPAEAHYEAHMVETAAFADLPDMGLMMEPE